MATSSTFSTDNQYIKYRIVVTESNVSIANNTSTINVKVDAWRTNTGYTTSGTGTCYCTIAGTKYTQSITASQEIKHNSHTVLFNRTINNFKHDADGSKNIYVQAKIDHQRFDSSYHGFTVSLTKIPRKANITSANDFTDEGTPLVMYSNPALENVESLRAGIALDDSVENPIIAYREINPLSTAYQFGLTSAERDALRASITGSNSRTIYYIIETVIGGATYYSQQQATLTIVNANPVAEGITYADINSTTTAITLDDQLIIQNKSSVNFNFASITAQKFARLSSVRITINSVVKTEYLSGSAVLDKNILFGLIDSASNETAEIVITDSRGNQQIYSVNISMLEWSTPSAIVKASRLSNFYSQTTILADASFSSLDNKNAITITWEYKERTASTYISGGSLSDNVPITANLDNEKAWDIRITVADLFAQQIYNLVVEIGIPIVFFDHIKRAMGINTFPSHNGALEINGDIHFSESGTNIRQIKGLIGGSDAFRIAGGASASDQGFMELATAGDGNEPIHVRQYSDDFQTVAKQITLLNSSGRTILNDLTAGFIMASNVLSSGMMWADSVELPHSFQDMESVVEKWKMNGDDEPVFEKTVEFQNPVLLANNVWFDVDENTVDNDVRILDIRAFNENNVGTNVWKCVSGQYLTATKKIQILNTRGADIIFNRVVYRYCYIVSP